MRLRVPVIAATSAPQNNPQAPILRLRLILRIYTTSTRCWRADTNYTIYMDAAWHTNGDDKMAVYQYITNIRYICSLSYKESSLFVELKSAIAPAPPTKVAFGAIGKESLNPLPSWIPVTTVTTCFKSLDSLPGSVRSKKYEI